MKKILMVLAVFALATISIFVNAENKNIKYLTNQNENSNIVYVNDKSLDANILKQEIIEIKKQENVKETIPNYDISLDKEIQQYLYSKCKEYEIEYELALAIIQVESNFKPNAVNVNSNNTKDVGLFQINSFNHKWLSEELGITDFADPYQNIDAGIFMLNNIAQNSEDIHEILIVYNMGRTNYNKLANRGITSSKYSRQVIEYKNNLKESEE